MGVVDGPSTPEGPPRSPLGESKIKHFFTEETLSPEMLLAEERVREIRFPSVNVTYAEPLRFRMPR